MNKVPTKPQNYQKTKKVIAIVSLLVVLAILGVVTWVVCVWLASFSQEGFRDYIRSFGTWGWLVMLLVQFLQVFVAFIPGELVETAAGFAFGPIGGTLICYAGLTAATALVFVLTKRFGVKAVELFVSRDKINELKFINTEKKRDFVVFILFFIPGTPKDVLTYLVAITDMKLGRFLVISLVARIPSVISSTFGGHLLGTGQYWGAILIYGITAIFSLVGLATYNRIIKMKKG